MTGAAGPFKATVPAPREVWRDALSADRDGLVSQSPEWTDCLCEVEGFTDASRFYEFPTGRQFVLPMVRRGPLPRLAIQGSLPVGWGMGGLIGRSPPTAEEVAAILDDLRHQPALSTRVRPNPLAARQWSAARAPGTEEVPRRAHVLDLQGGFDHVWGKRFGSSTRRQVRQAENAGVTVECDTTGRLVPVFHELLNRSVERWARQQHEPLPLARWRARLRDPLRKFQHIAAILGKACRIWVAWVGDKPAATILVLQSAQTAHYTRGAMDKELAGPTRANILLHKMAIEEACASGCRHYHMGETGSSESLARFKARFGAAPFAYAEYRIERLPLSRLDAALRRSIKRAIGFKD